MANSQLAEAAQQAIQDKQFNAWLKSIGKEGQKLIQKLFVETAKKDLKLASLAKEDPESTMILFAYQVYLQLNKQANNEQASSELEQQNVEPEEDGLEDMNNPPLTSPITAKFGAKLNHIIKLNGHCPEGYEIQYYSMGGHLCGKCRKKKQLLMQSMSCGGKKRIKKNLEGSEIKTVKKPKYYGEMAYVNPYPNKQVKPVQKPLQVQNDRMKKAPTREQLLQRINPKQVIKKQDEGGEVTKKRFQVQNNTLDSIQLAERKKRFEENLKKFNRLHSGEQIKVNSTPKANSMKRKSTPTEELEKAMKKSKQPALKNGGKTLTKAKANSLKYKGGPGDINSTEGMKPNKKQRKMLSRKVGGMVNNAKKITIYQQPDMFDYIKY